MDLKISARTVRPPTPIAFRGLRACVLPVLITCSLWLLRSNEVSLTAVACSLLLALVPVISYFHWREHAESSAAPLFPLVAFMFWLSFSVPAFWGRETLIGPGGERHIPTFAINSAMMAAAVGVAAMWGGYSLRLGKRAKPQELLLFQSAKNSHIYLWFITFIGLIGLRFVEPVVRAMSSGLTQPIRIAVQFTPMAAFAILIIEYFRGRTTYLDRIGLAIYVAGRLAVGLASGWLGSAVATGLVVIFAYAMKWRRLPAIPLAATLLVILFLQPGKENFRSRFWYGGETGGVTERIYEWGAESTRLWRNALLGESGGEWRDLGISAVSRFDLLHQTANVIDFTPAVVPYQHGRLYSYLLVTYVPRFVWPNKPSVSDANRWYQVTYGLTDEENLDSVSIACGFLAEAYINFGWLGIPIVMFAIGVFLDLIDRVLLSRASGVYFNALGLALVPQLIAIESQLGQYIAGIAQMIVLTTVVLLPVLVWKRKAERRALAATRLAGVRRPSVTVVQPKPLSPA